MKRFFLYVLGLFVALSVHAQHRLSGKVVDGKGGGIPSATVRVLGTDSVFVSGSLSDSTGIFSVPGLKEGAYLLSVSYVGYSPGFVRFDMPASDYVLPPVTLDLDDVMLEGVTVTASSFVRKKDHILVIPDRQQVRHSFTGYDLLYNLMIPGLTVDRKNRTVTALAGEARLYINGVRADMREVQNLQPKDVEKVEFYTLPVSGPFAGDAAAVNYVTKVYKAGGYVTVDGEQTIGYTKGDYNVASKVSRGNTSYTFFGGYNMHRHGGTELEKEETLFLQDYGITRRTVNDGGLYKGSQQYAQFKVGNDTRKRNLSVLASFVRDDSPHDDMEETLTYGGHENRIVESSDLNGNESLKGSLNLNGVFNVSDRQQWKARLNGSYTKNRYARIYLEDTRRSLGNADEDLFSFDGYVACSYRIDGKNLLYGNISHFHNVSSSLYRGDYASWQHLWKGESLMRVDYTHIFSDKVMAMASPGVSWINYRLHGQELQDVWNFRLNAWVRYLFSRKQWAALGVAVGNSQPDISYLNTATQTVDFYQVKRGNPYLDNTQLFTVFGMYEGMFHPMFNVLGKLTCQKSLHNIHAVYSVENGRLVGSYVSDDSFDDLSVEVGISSRFSESFRTNVNLKYSYRDVPEMSGLRESGFFASLDVNYFIKAFSVNAYASTTERTLDPVMLAYIKRPASYGLSVRYSGSNWMAEVGTENPFTRHLHYREYADYGVYRYSQVRTSRTYQQTAYVKLAYTFGFGRNTSRESNNVDRSINSALLKAR